MLTQWGWTPTPSTTMWTLHIVVIHDTPLMHCSYGNDADTVVLDSYSIHDNVDTAVFDSERVLQLVPPEGHFNLMTYRCASMWQRVAGYIDQGSVLCLLSPSTESQGLASICMSPTLWPHPPPTSNTYCCENHAANTALFSLSLPIPAPQVHFPSFLCAFLLPLSFQPPPRVKGDMPSSRKQADPPHTHTCILLLPLPLSRSSRSFRPPFRVYPLVEDDMLSGDKLTLYLRLLAEYPPAKSASGVEVVVPLPRAVQRVHFETGEAV